VDVVPACVADAEAAVLVQPSDRPLDDPVVLGAAPGAVDWTRAGFGPQTPARATCRLPLATSRSLRLVQPCEQQLMQPLPHTYTRISGSTNSHSSSDTSGHAIVAILSHEGDNIPSSANYRSCFSLGALSGRPRGDGRHDDQHGERGHTEITHGRSDACRPVLSVHLPFPLRSGPQFHLAAPAKPPL